VESILPLLSCNLSFKFRFTVVTVYCCFWFTVNTVWPVSVPEFMHGSIILLVRVECRRKTVHVRCLISWWASCIVYPRESISVTEVTI